MRGTRRQEGAWVLRVWAVALVALLLLLQGCGAVRARSVEPACRAGECGGGNSPWESAEVSTFEVRGLYLENPTQAAPEPALLGEGPGVELSGPVGPVEEEALQAEVESALGQAWGVVREAFAPGSRVQLVFWLQHGAFTLLSWERSGGAGGGVVQPASRGEAVEPLREVLRGVARQRTGAVVLTFHRGKRGWLQGYEALTLEEPQEARRWPSRGQGDTGRVEQTLRVLTADMVSKLRAPSTGHAQVEVEVQWEDGRVVGWRQGSWQEQPQAPVQCEPGRAAETLTRSLAPFARALGPRVVRLHLAGTQPGAPATACWRVDSAHTLRPPPPPAELVDVNREYHLLHAYIFERYEREMRDSAVLAAGFTFEQVALWVVGGLVGKGLHVAYKAVAPTMVKVLSAGGRQAVGWLRALLARAGSAQRQQLIRLWTKVETEGLEALTRAERQQLSALMRHLEQTLATPLDDDMKTYFRETARREFYREFPKLVEKLHSHGGMTYDVHHLIPLEHAHLFRELNINAFENLVAVAKPVHRSVGKVWTVFRSRQKTVVSVECVREVEKIIARQFSGLYNQVFENTPVARKALMDAEQAAIAEVEQLLMRLGR